MDKRISTQVFDVLSNGDFITHNSRQNNRAYLYDVLDSEYEQYKDFFEGVGFYLERGDGFFYFSQDDTDSEVKRKCSNWMRWIDIYFILKTYDQNFGCGTRFTISHLANRLDTELDLRHEVQKKYPNKSFLDIARTIVEELKKMDFIELIDEIEERYVVTPAIRYVEEFIRNAEINENYGEEAR